MSPDLRSDLIEGTIVVTMPATPYEIAYSRYVKQHLAAIDRKYYSLIRDSIEQQLSFDPAVQARNRKPLEEPNVFGEAWELRFGPQNRFRAFYRVDEGAREVFVLAVGVKVGDRLLIGGEEIDL